MPAAQAYWVTRPGAGELRTEQLPVAPPPRTTRIRTEFSAVSSGTERLVGLGRVPAALESSMACVGMAGSFSLPVKYGYSLVGVAENGACAGRRVFAMHPHQDLADVGEEWVTPLTDGVPSARAALIPNLETALNATWDAEPMPAGEVAVFGAGAVGMLIAFALAREHGVRPTVVEPMAERRALAARLLDVTAAVAPDAVRPESFALAFHTTGQPRVLQAALDAVGFEGRVIELSWYGDQRVELDLGGAFHARRKQIWASQVGAVAPRRRATHDRHARLRQVQRLLADPASAVLDGLLGQPAPFDSLPVLMSEVYRGTAAAVVPLICYAASSVS
ncbi:MAG: zinc-binding alcohol dehydrogenase [Planctomycetota bacterium]